MPSDPVRDEAERLVAAALAAVSLAARGLGGSRTSSFATGSAECCVCPVCRVIAAMRDPNADIAERLATGAGDLASGVASLLRSLSRPGPSASAEPSEADAFWDGLRQRSRADGDDDILREEDLDDEVWAAATRTPGAAEPAAPPPPMAKKAVKKAAKKAAAVPDPPPAKKVAKKAVKKAPGPASSGLRSAGSEATGATREDGASRGPGAGRAKASPRKMAP
jgi:hypothetical protein